MSGLANVQESAALGNGQQVTLRSRALPLMLLKMSERPIFPSDYMFLRFSFLACFTLNTIPQKYLNKGEKQGFFQCGLLVKGPKEMGLYWPPLSICTKGFCDPRQAASPCPESPPATYTVWLLIPSWSFKSGWRRPVEHLGERVPQDFCIMYQGESFNSREKNGTIWHQLQAS